MYVARSLSFHDASFEIAHLPVGPAFVTMWDAAAAVWLLMRGLMTKDALLQACAVASMGCHKIEHSMLALDTKKGVPVEPRPTDKAGKRVPPWLLHAWRHHRPMPSAAKSPPKGDGTPSASPAGTASASSKLQPQRPYFPRGKVNPKLRVLQRVATQFSGAHQRWASQMIMAAKVPGVADIALRAVREGLAVIVGLQSTGEAADARVAAAQEVREEGAGRGGDSDDENEEEEEEDDDDDDEDESDLADESDAGTATETESVADGSDAKAAASSSSSSSSSAAAAATPKPRPAGANGSSRVSPPGNNKAAKEDPSGRLTSTPKEIMRHTVSKYMLLPPIPLALLRKYGQEHLIPKGYSEAEVMAQAAKDNMKSSGGSRGRKAMAAAADDAYGADDVGSDMPGTSLSAAAAAQFDPTSGLSPEQVAGEEAKACAAYETMALLRWALLEKIDALKLPPNPLDFLIDKLHGPANVAEVRQLLLIS